MPIAEHARPRRAGQAVSDLSRLWLGLAPRIVERILIVCRRRRVGLGSQLKALRNPRQRHRRLARQPLRDEHFHRASFAPGHQNFRVRFFSL